MIVTAALSVLAFLIMPAGAARAFIDVVGVLETRAHDVRVERFTILWGTRPNEVFRPTWGGTPQSTDSFHFTVSRFPPAVELRYAVDSGEVMSETLISVVEDSWYRLPFAFDSTSPRVKFADITGIGEERTQALPAILCRPSPFVRRVEFGAAAQDGDLEVVVYDACGKSVWFAELHSGVPAVWDGRDQNGLEVPDGVYVCRVRSRDRARAVRLVKASGR